MNTEQNKNPLDAQAESAAPETREEPAPAGGGAEEIEEIKEAVPAPQPAAPAKRPLNANRWKRGGMAALSGVVFIAIIVALNIVVSALTERFPSMDIDLTAEKRNSLSQQALDIAQGITEDTEVFLVGEEEAYRQDRLYANYGFKFSQIANLAERLQEANPRIKVSFVDPDTNPELMGEYAAESLTNGMVLVRTAKRHKILTVYDMFDMSQSQMTGATQTYTKVDSALAAALETVNLEKVPVLTIATGHGELLSGQNMGQFIALMESRNFTVQEVDVLTEEIPGDTQVLMIPTPTNDYTEDEIQKLQAFLDDPQRQEPVALLATCHPSQGDLPRLTGFLEEWGIQVHSGVVAESSSGRMAAANASYVLVDPSGATLSENTYNRLLAPSSAPLSLAFSENGGITTTNLWRTADTAYVITESTTQEETENPETAQWTVAAMATKTVEGVSRHVIVFGSSFVFTDSFIEATAFGNRDYIGDLLALTTGTDGSAVTVAATSVETNVMDITISRGGATVLGLGVFTVGLPLLILAVGLAIFLKRRHL